MCAAPLAKAQSVLTPCPRLTPTEPAPRRERARRAPCPSQQPAGESSKAWSVARAAAARLAPHGTHRASQSGWTPLHWAAENAHAELVAQLVGLGADVNGKMVSCEEWMGQGSEKSALPCPNENSQLIFFAEAVVRSTVSSFIRPPVCLFILSIFT
jgi:hypothetical protein